MTAATRVVFDCNTFLQALSSPHGPAGQCVRLAMAGELHLFISPRVLDELVNVASRPRVAARLRITSDRLHDFIQVVESAATALVGFPEPFVYQRDPDDAHYVNLALAADARLIVSRDRDLLDLMDPAKPDAPQFLARFPLLRILDPVTFLREIETPT